MLVRKRSIAIAVAIAALLLLVWTLKNSKQDPPQTRASAVATKAELRKRGQEGLATLANALSVAAQHTIGLVSISGKVQSLGSQQAVPYAEVFFVSLSGESSTTCDEHGSFSVELAPGFYRSYARAPGYVAVADDQAQRLPEPVSVADVAVPKESLAPLLGVFRNQRNVRLSLAPAATIVGRVVDESGSAIVGAIVQAKAFNGTRVLSGDDVTETDASGHYELIVPLGSAELEANHSDYAGIAPNSSPFITTSDAGQTVELDLTLVRGCIVEGKVVDEHGDLIWEGSFEHQEPDGSFVPIGKIRNGQVRYAQRQEGIMALRAWPWKHAPSPTQEFACDGENRYLDEVFVVPFATPSLTGRVLDASGHPVPFAFIDLFGLNPGSSPQQERADENGDFAFYQLPDGPYQLSSSHATRGVGLTLIEAPSTGFSLHLGGTGSLLGQVEDHSATMMTVKYQCTLEDGQGGLALTDPLSMPEQTLLVPLQNGRFRMDALPACTMRGTLKVGEQFRVFRVVIAPEQDTLLEL